MQWHWSLGFGSFDKSTEVLMSFIEFVLSSKVSAIPRLVTLTQAHHRHLLRQRIERARYYSPKKPQPQGLELSFMTQVPNYPAH